MTQAAVLHAFGEIPRCEPFSEPVAGDGEVIVQVRAAALKPIDQQLASGLHYGSGSHHLPFVCGTDGAGRLDDSTRVLFAKPRPPYGAMGQRTVVARSLCFPIPDDVDDRTAAAVFNPGLSAWASLAWRAKLVAGETVLILGATGVTGKLAIQTAKLLGAGRVVAAGRNEQVLSTLHDLGADSTIRLQGSPQNLIDAFAHEAGEKAFDVIIDYLWGRPTEALLAALTRSDLKSGSSRVRLVQVGESAGPALSLQAATLRSSRLEILGAGSGSAPPAAMWVDALQQLMTDVASGKLRIDTEPVPLADIQTAWRRDQAGRRLVMIP
ncbi:MAG TPA: zinc-binding alcohol dehydrogenase family protein [Bryobacteraceae bacterium]|nr:zinc-binding alcohol dehydrogenase family protein [Bryobacteraceae bacterium]